LEVAVNDKRSSLLEKFYSTFNPDFSRVPQIFHRELLMKMTANGADFIEANFG